METIPKKYKAEFNSVIKHSGVIADTDIKPALIETKDATLLSTHEFICYLGAMGMYIDYLKTFDGLRTVRYSTEEIVVALHDLDSADIGIMTAIIWSIADGKRKVVAGISMEQLVIDYFELAENRSLFMNKSHKELAGFKQGVERYQSKTDNDLIMAANYVLQCLDIT